MNSLQEQLNAILEPQRRLQEQFAHMFEPQHRMQEQLKHILEPQCRMQEQLKHILEPQRRMQEQLKHILEPQRRIQEQLKHILEPQRRMQEQLKHILEPQRRMQEQLKHILEPQRRMQEQLKHIILEPQRRMQEQLAQILEPQRKIQEQLSHILEPQRLFQENIKKYLTPLNELISNPLMQEVAFSENGEFAVSGEVVDLETISDGIEKLPDDWQDSEVFFSSFFSLLGKLNEPSRIVFLYIFLPYIIAIFANLTTPIFQEIVDDFQGNNQRTVKKEIILEANSFYDASELLGHRFVYATALHVRNEGSTKSEIIDEISLGKTVKLIEKAKRWSFIGKRSIKPT
ncbi:hypothetical protein ACJJIF_06280 [Microbulbifer sp. SSSA002]|uniref:hypothetical protein n=1 Tax=Microbulbifer sp. SSSA002 TaxID=3243376 RepID=UPI0040393E8A